MQKTEFLCEFFSKVCFFSSYFSEIGRHPQFLFSLSPTCLWTVPGVDVEGVSDDGADRPEYCYGLGPPCLAERSCPRRFVCGRILMFVNLYPSKYLPDFFSEFRPLTVTT